MRSGRQPQARLQKIRTSFAPVYLGRARCTRYTSEQEGSWRGFGAGAYCIDHTTNDPKVVQAVGGALTARGVGFLDAPLDGGREGAVAGELNLFVGGEEVVVETLRSVLGAAARNVVHVGALGTGSTTKIVHNALAMSIDLLITECLTVGVKAGVALPSLVEAFSHGCIVSENMTFTKRMPATLFRGDFSARFALKLAHKDFGLARDLAAEHGVPVQLLSLCAEELAEAVRRGWGEEDRTRASSLQEERAGIEPRRGRWLSCRPFSILLVTVHSASPR